MSQFVSGFAAVIGRPNVGKSSLINTMVGEKSPLFPINHRPRATVSWAWSTERGTSSSCWIRPASKTEKQAGALYGRGGAP